jgi:hypothetical protein
VVAADQVVVADQATHLVAHHQDLHTQGAIHHQVTLQAQGLPAIEAQVAVQAQLVDHHQSEELLALGPIEHMLQPPHMPTVTYPMA